MVSAAIQGRVAILDGIHRIHRGTLAVLHRLVHDRELQLYDGTRLLRSDRYEEAKRLCGLTDRQVQSVFRIQTNKLGDFYRVSLATYEARIIFLGHLWQYRKISSSQKP